MLSIETSAELEAKLIIGSTTESLHLDFKKTVNGWKIPRGTEGRQQARREGQKELCRDIAQFANTEGGCLLIGVDEQTDESSHLRIAAGKPGVDDPDRLVQWIEQAVRQFLVPATFSHHVVAIAQESVVVLAVNVQPSRHLVALWDSEQYTIEYVYRTSHGKAWFNPDEAERHVMNGSRAAKLALQEARSAARSTAVEIAGGFVVRWDTGTEKRVRPAGPVEFAADGEGWFELLVPTGQGLCTLTVPYGLVREAWVDALGRVNVLFSARLVLNTGGLGFEAFQ